MKKINLIQLIVLVLFIAVCISVLPYLSTEQPQRIHRTLSTDRWKATASHNNVQIPIKRAFDGDISTRWDSGTYQTSGMWFKVDLGSVYEINRVELDTQTTPEDYPKGCKINISADGENYSTIWEMSSPYPMPLIESILSVPQKARYIMFEQIGESQNTFWSIHEIRVIGEKEISEASKYSARLLKQAKPILFFTIMLIVLFLLLKEELFEICLIFISFCLYYGGFNLLDMSYEHKRLGICFMVWSSYLSILVVMQIINITKNRIFLISYIFAPIFMAIYAQYLFNIRKSFAVAVCLYPIAIWLFGFIVNKISKNIK